MSKSKYQKLLDQLEEETVTEDQIRIWQSAARSILEEMAHDLRKKALNDEEVVRELITAKLEEGPLSITPVYYGDPPTGDNVRFLASVILGVEGYPHNAFNAAAFVYRCKVRFYYWKVPEGGNLREEQ